ncbi:MAG: ATP-binding protein [Deltaproteobacteria bacterium]
MTIKNNRPEQAAPFSADMTDVSQANSLRLSQVQAETALRRQAEEIARENTALTLENLKPLSLEEIRQMLHELRVHQIELELQNEELRRTQAQLEVALTRYFDLYDIAPVGYCTLSEKGQILEANLTAATLLGLARSKLVNHQLSRFIFKEDQTIYYLHRKHLFETGKPQEWDLRMVKNDETAFWTHIESTVAQDTDGTPVGRIVMSDITNRKQAEALQQRTHDELEQQTESLRASLEEKVRLEARLLQSQKMESIGSLAGGIAHDLNNILFPISGLSEMLLDDSSLKTPERESIEQIYKSAQRGGELVKQILTFSRQSNPMKLPIRIQPILKEALKLARATIPRKIEITNQIEANCGMILADPTQVHQIAMNLITNACHAVEGNGGTIHISLKKTVDGYACICVSDTGTGIDQTQINKIFDPYFTTKELGKGTGLGLSVVHGIVKAHGGDIRVHSEVGKGTTFNVFLPLLDDPKNGKAATITRQYPRGCERILLVDDEEPIVLLEQMMLERLGYQITFRTSSPDALAVFKANSGNFDLVISDRGMPLMTGEQLARELILIKPWIPIIICTGFSDENDVKRAKAMGVKGFLMKPVAIGDLAEMVRKVLDEETPVKTDF